MDMGCGCATVFALAVAGMLGISQCQREIEQKETEQAYKVRNDSARAYALSLSHQTRSLVERLDSVRANAEHLQHLAGRAHAIAERYPDVADMFLEHERKLSSLRDSLVAVGNTIERDMVVLFLARQMQEEQRGVSYSEKRDELLRAADNLLHAARAAREQQTRAMIGDPGDYRHD